MALPFFNGAKKKRNQIMAIDLGSRITKAVLMERRGEVLALMRYAMLDAPIYDRKFSVETVGEHLKSVAEALGNTTKAVALSIQPDDAVVRNVELPQMPQAEMRQLMKLNSKNFLQQDLPNYCFDVHIFPPKKAEKPEPGAKQADPKNPVLPKLNVLVAGSRQQLINDYQAAIRAAGLIPEVIVPGLVGPINAFELSQPSVFESDSIAIVDVGFKHSSICLMDRGEFVLTRGVNIGGDKLTAGVAEAMNVTYAEAEGIKIGLAPEARPVLETQVAPLGRELRASIDFFEHQQDRPVQQVFVCGGPAKSEMFLELLREEMIAECKTWNPTSALQLALPGTQTVEVEHVGPQLAVAIGTAVAAF